MADTGITLLSRGQQGAPSLDLNFAAGLFGIEGVTHPTLLSVPGVSFSRTTAGYANGNASGLWKQFGINVPRITDQGLLVEEQRTNLFLQSSTFGTSPWSVSAATTAPNGTLGPDNTAAAYYLAETTANAEHDLQQNVTVTANTVYTMSFYVAPNLRNKVYIRDNALGAAASFDLAAGTVTTGTGTGFISARIGPFGYGYFRCDLTYRTGAAQTTAAPTLCPLNGSGASVYVGQATPVALLLWNAQFEAGYNASSPIKTTTASATRTADTCSGPLLNTTGTALSTCIVPINDPTKNNVILGCSGIGFPLLIGVGTSQPAAYDFVAGVLGVAMTATPYATLNMGVAWAPGTRTFSSSGLTVSDGGAVGGAASIIGSYLGAQYMNSFIKRLQIFNYQYNRLDLVAASR